MCVILDNNVIRDIFAADCSQDFLPLKDAIHAGRANIVYGGKLKKEYLICGLVAEYLLELDRRGLARQVSDKAVEKETSAVRKLSICESDDEHVVALARVSGARLLCSLDQRLHVDFGNKKLIDKPRGSVYQNSSHVALIGKHCKKKN